MIRKGIKTANNEPWFSASEKFPCLSFRIWSEISGSLQSKPARLLHCRPRLVGWEMQRVVQVSSRDLGLSMHYVPLKHCFTHAETSVYPSQVSRALPFFLRQIVICRTLSILLAGPRRACTGSHALSWFSNVTRTEKNELSKKFKTVIWLSFYIGGKIYICLKSWRWFCNMYNSSKRIC